MNLEALRQKILGQTKTVEVGGEKYRIQKLSAVDGLEVDALLRTLEMDGEGDNATIKHPQDLVRLYSLLLSKAIVDESGNKTLDSDEGRDLLSKLSDFVELGGIAMDWHAQKKS
jgi:hypothetical protein